MGRGKLGDKFWGICGLQSFQLPINDSCLKCFSQTGQTFTIPKTPDARKLLPAGNYTQRLCQTGPIFTILKASGKRGLLDTATNHVASSLKFIFAIFYTNAEMAKEFL